MKGFDLKFAALQLCTVLGIIYMVQVLFGFEPGFNASSSPPWKFFTSILGHSDAEHLFNNLFFIGLFGTIFERLTSGKLFLFTFLTSALFANLSAFVFFPNSFIIGASGGATGLLAALALYRPRQIGLALGIPAPMWLVFFIYLFINFAGLSGNTNVAYEAHLLGMVIGGIIGFQLRERDYLESLRDEEDDEKIPVEEDTWKERIREWEKKWMIE